MDVKIESSWKAALQAEFSQPYFAAIVDFLKTEKNNILRFIAIVERNRSVEVKKLKLRYLVCHPIVKRKEEIMD